MKKQQKYYLQGNNVLSSESEILLDESSTELTRVRIRDILEKIK